MPKLPKPKTPTIFHAVETAEKVGGPAIKEVNKMLGPGELPYEEPLRMKKLSVSRYMPFKDPGMVVESAPPSIETAPAPLITQLHIPGGSMHEIVRIDEGAMFGDRVVTNPCGSDEHSGAVQGPESKRGSRPIGYGAADQKKNSPLDETIEHMLEDTSR